MAHGRHTRHTFDTARPNLSSSSRPRATPPASAPAPASAAFRDPVPPLLSSRAQLSPPAARRWPPPRTSAVLVKRAPLLLGYHRPIGPTLPRRCWRFSPTSCEESIPPPPVPMDRAARPSTACSVLSLAASRGFSMPSQRRWSCVFIPVGRDVLLNIGSAPRMSRGLVLAEITLLRLSSPRPRQSSVLTSVFGNIVHKGALQSPNRHPASAIPPPSSSYHPAVSPLFASAQVLTDFSRPIAHFAPWGAASSICCALRPFIFLFQHWRLTTARMRTPPAHRKCIVHLLGILRAPICI
ncbi:hypothetical protein C8R47DRAFT_1228498 [Mycena vitilis]|nr:hypothetical protein C8R47DRAFT_1228498 [Mycena vitilis]